jgi:hypothetical protein
MGARFSQLIPSKILVPFPAMSNRYAWISYHIAWGREIAVCCLLFAVCSLERPGLSVIAMHELPSLIRHERSGLCLRTVYFLPPLSCACFLHTLPIAATGL